jgi:hypothetical protein
MSEICRQVHEWVNGLESFGLPFPEERVPTNGIYVLFEEGERGHGTSRIVRIGTHTGANQLRSRLKQHFLNRNKDRSIFRKNIGRALLQRDGDPFLQQWEIDLTTRANRERYGADVDREKLASLEQRVSEVIQTRFRFAVFEIPDQQRRLHLESRLVSTVSLCADCGPSAQWLGMHSPKAKIRESGLWQVNELYKEPLTSQDLQ